MKLLAGVLWLLALGDPPAPAPRPCSCDNGRVETGIVLGETRYAPCPNGCTPRTAR